MNKNGDLSPLNCKNCKGLTIKPIDYDLKINYWRSLQMDAINNIKTIRLYLLLPYLSPDRFFYDTETDAWHRNDLKRILMKGSTDIEFLEYLNNQGIVIVECCFCPLHRFFLHGIPLSVMSKTIALCFKRHNLQFLKINKKAPIITLFDEPDDYADVAIAGINSRIITNFKLYHLQRSNKRFLKLVKSITGMYKK